MVTPQGADELKAMRKKWLDKHKLEPSEDVAPTDNQLSMLHRLVAMDYNVLSFDMGVWGPYGGRRERSFTMMAHVQNIDGTYSPEGESRPTQLGGIGFQHGISPQ